MNITKENIEQIKLLNNMNVSANDISKVIGCSKRTVERVLNNEHYLQTKEELTKSDKEKIMDVSCEMSRKALRVLGLAKSFNDVLKEENLIFVGMVGMIDPPRPEAKNAVETGVNNNISENII